MAWWLIPSAAIAIGLWLSSDDEKDKKKVVPKPSLSILENNFVTLGQSLQNSNKKKRILLIGQPGAGKSSLLKKLTYGKCEPLPIIGQQTDATHWHDKKKDNFFHAYNQMIFVDSPGYDTMNHPVSSYIEHFPFNKFDLIILVINNKVHKADQEIAKKLQNMMSISTSTRCFIVRSFSENLSPDEKKDLRNDIQQKLNFNKSNKPRLIFASSRNDDGLDEIRGMLS